MTPVIAVSPIDPEYNIGLVARWVSPTFNQANQTLPFAESTYALFPELRGRISEGMTSEQIRAAAAPVVLAKLKEHEGLLEAKIAYLQAYFHNINDELLSALAAAHETAWPADCKRIDCYVGCLPRCPRNVVTKKLWVSCSMDDTALIRATLHELAHFMFYEKWKAIYGPVPQKDLGHPSPRWFLEEMAVDPLLNSAEVQSVVPLEHRAYPQFYSESIDGIPIMEHIKTFYAARESVEDFIRRAYRFVEDNIAEIIAKCG